MHWPLDRGNYCDNGRISTVIYFKNRLDHVWTSCLWHQIMLIIFVGANTNYVQLQMMFWTPNLFFSQFTWPYFYAKLVGQISFDYNI
jgi:hypothetical protein